MKGKISYVEIYSKNEFSVREIVKKEKYALVLMSPHTAKVTSTVRDKCLIKMEIAEMSPKYVLIFKLTKIKAQTFNQESITDLRIYP